MRRRSRKREAALRERPAISSVPEPHERSACVGAEDLGLQEFVRRLPCVVCRVPTLRGDPAHRLARRRFGDWVEDTEIGVIANIYPACRPHHREQHDRGRDTFEATHAVDLRAICVVVGEAYLLGWSADALGARARSGYTTIDVFNVDDFGIPY
jgi:hypothetical protein